MPEWLLTHSPYEVLPEADHGPHERLHRHHCRPPPARLQKKWQMTPSNQWFAQPSPNLKSRNSYVHILLLDFSLAFNTIIPQTLVQMLSSLGPTLRNWGTGSWTFWQTDLYLLGSTTLSKVHIWHSSSGMHEWPLNDQVSAEGKPESSSFSAIHLITWTSSMTLKWWCQKITLSFSFVQ